MSAEDVTLDCQRLYKPQHAKKHFTIHSKAQLDTENSAGILIPETSQQSVALTSGFWLS